MKRDEKKKKEEEGKGEKKQWKKKKEMKDKNKEIGGKGVQEKCYFKGNRGKIEKNIEKKREKQ